MFCKNADHHGKCPAYGKVCHNCNRKNHFMKCCPRNRKILHKIKEAETESLSADDYKFLLGMINLQKTPENIWLTFLKSKMNPPIGILLCLLMIL